MTCSTYHQGVSTPLGETSPSYSIVSSPYSGVVLLTGISTPHEGAIPPILKASRPLTREMTPSWDVPPLRCPLQSDPLRGGHHVNLSSSVYVYSPTALSLYSNHCIVGDKSTTIQQPLVRSRTHYNRRWSRCSFTLFREVDDSFHDFQMITWTSAD